ncbi:MAG: hypothetical protein RIG68_24070 [Imperialibacter sp.]
MLMKVTTRDVRVFLFGMLFVFLIVLVYDWQEFKRGFMGQPRVEAPATK